MNKTIVAFGASNSKESINSKLAEFTARQVENVSVNTLNLNDYEMPIYSIDRELESGIPDLAHDFKSQIKNADGIVISFAEHNGSYSVAFKNIFDWISRIDQDIWMNKPMFLLATSPGGYGAQTVLNTATDKFKRMNTNAVVSFSLPSFMKNFTEEGISDEVLANNFDALLKEFSTAVFEEN